jgi:hypothetical protein
MKIKKPIIDMTGKKTLLAAAVNVVLVFMPEVRNFIMANPEFYAALVSFGATILRIQTTTPVVAQPVNVAQDLRDQ